MKDVIAKIADWPFLQQLPAAHGDFALSAALAAAGPQVNIFSYHDPVRRRNLSVLYDGLTRDFMVRVTVGLHEFVDVSFISADLTGLEKILAAKLIPALDNLSDGQHYESIFRAKKILDWPFAGELPTEYAGFGLFIAPGRPLRTINGSYVIVDYSDFISASNLSIHYNVYRDEFFGQASFRHTPETVGVFDTRDLDELAGKLKSNLRPVLEELRERIIATEGEPTP